MGSTLVITTKYNTFFEGRKNHAEFKPVTEQSRILDLTELFCNVTGKMLQNAAGNGSWRQDSPLLAVHIIDQKPPELP